MKMSRRAAVEALILLLLCAVAVGHVVWFGGWVVEDSAISFAYARHLAHGDGLVPWVGGERVEGYSNPTWVALLALGELAGIAPYWTAKTCALLLTTLTTVLVYRLARRATSEPGASWVSPTAPLAAAAAFAFNTQVGIFGAAGLENPLFSLLLGMGILTTARDPLGLASVPWWGLLAVTRPEGPVYAAIGGVMTVLAGVRARRAGPVLRWIAAIGAPLAVYHAIRYWYFAWPFPMTFYAKVDQGPDILGAWDGPGWIYLRAFATGTGQGWFLPAYLFGAVGLLGWRGRVGFAAIALGAVLILAPVGPIRPLGLLVVGLLPLLGALGDGGNAVRVQCWAAGLVSVAFAVASGGDWMHGFRWMAMAAVPCAVLLAAGLSELEATLTDLPGAGMAGVAAAVAAFAGLNLEHTARFDDHREISPFFVRRRVEVAQRAFRATHVDERPACFTVDMGGYMWWSGMELLDFVGLIDVPVAMHGRDPRFLDEYVFQERRPHLMEIGYFKKRLGQITAIDRDYVHFASFSLRRDLLVTPAWPWPGDVRDLDGARISGVHVESPEVAAGGHALVEVGFEPISGEGFTAAIRLLDADRTLATWRVQPGLGILLPAGWRAGEILDGRFELALPDDLPPGTYDLEVDLGLPGRARFPGQVRIVGAEEALAAAQADLDAAHGLAGRGGEGAERCDEAHARWVAARDHVLTDAGFATREGPAIEAEIGRCYVAAAATDPARRVDLLALARSHAAEDPAVVAACRSASDERYAAGEAARARSDWEGAYRGFSDAVRLVPTRSWARRYAEEARDHRLAAAALDE